MEYVSKIDIFRLKIMVKSSLEIYFFKFLHSKTFSDLLIYFIKGRIFALNNKIALFAHGGISKKFFVVYMYMVNETLSQKFHPYSILST